MSDRNFDAEDDFHEKDRKASRKERKLATTRDRSKFKKSDQDQIKKRAESLPPPDENLTRGLVLAVTPEGIVVDADQKEFMCALKGILKKENLQIKNLVAVGDYVHFAPTGEKAGVIAYVEPRRSVLSRADNLSRRKEQLIAVNIDQVLITCSVVLPALKPFLIDRYIIAAHKGNMQPIIVVNKIDFLTSPPDLVDPIALQEEKRLYTEFLQTYRDLQIPIYPVSVKTGEGMNALKQAMHGKTSVFSGQSGVGKSSLINAVTGLDLRTGGIVGKTQKGSHTTTTAHLIPLDQGGFCIDTPGIKSFGIWDLDLEEVQGYFSEITSFAPHCKFPDCHHLQEPGCAVQKAVEEGKISPLRFASYCALMTSIAEEHKNR